jgi:hypothetical protein
MDIYRENIVTVILLTSSPAIALLKRFLEKSVFILNESRIYFNVFVCTAVYENVHLLRPPKIVHIVVWLVNVVLL